LVINGEGVQLVLSGLAPASIACALGRDFDMPLCGFQDGEHGYSPVEEQMSAAVGGNVLVVASARAEKQRF